MERHLLLGVFVLAGLLFFGCGAQETATEYVCSDGSTVSSPSFCAKESSPSSQAAPPSQPPTQPSSQPPSCSPAFLDEYNCSDNDTIRKYQNANCDYAWVFYEECMYGCDGGKCNPESKEEQEPPTTPSTCSPGYLDEYRCKGNNIERKYQYSDCDVGWVHGWHCAYGCENEKCRPCTDSDGGKDYYTKGYIDYFSDGKVYDECKTGVGYENYLVEHYCKLSEVDYCDNFDASEYEHYCDNSEIGIEDYECLYGCKDGECQSEPVEETITVTKVIDGDTIELSSGETVRLIGINAPEYGEACYYESKEELEHVVLRKPVELEKDTSETDRYGRLLRYVYVYGAFVNEAMIKEGFAISYPYEPDTKYAVQLTNWEEYARENNRGCLWQSSEEDYIQDECIYIVNFHYDAAGDDNYNLNDEYVTFGNRCSYSIDMESWTVRDKSSSNSYTFAPFTFQPGSTFMLYTGAGANSVSSLYWGKVSGAYAAVWNNNGDTLYLRNEHGEVVLTDDY